MSRLEFASPLQAFGLRRTLLILLLGGVVITQALGNIYIKQTNRTLYAKLQSLQAARDNYHVEWSQLLLERGTWANDARVEKIAREVLGMTVPETITVIRP